ncbi:hypothetical protein BSKO_04960 [Bryopsis sp. KO-2023]|nr:hypothetical protein BSKO_04960 [Bryopsis sp. KO-2023]
MSTTPTPADDADVSFLLASGYLVFFMQCGFCMLSAGSVRSKNAKNIILKNLLDACFGALGFYLLGYGIAFGADGNKFIGGKGFGLKGVDTAEYATWFFQFAFAATAATIVSGAVAERTKFQAYLLYAFFLTAWVYPIVAHWVWSDEGWLSVNLPRKELFNGSGMIDFAGCGVVHMVGGFAGLAGAWCVGPRLGRYDQGGKARDIPGHSAPLALLGVFILWFGWYGFNPGSAFTIIGSSRVVALCAVNTTLAAAAGTVTTLGLTMARLFGSTGILVWDTVAAGNGALAGLVSITAGCSVVHPWAAVLIGTFGGAVYSGSSYLVAQILMVDDPLDAIAVHGFCGMWGLLATAAFAEEDLVGLSYGDFVGEDGEVGRRAFGFIAGGDGRLLVAAITGIMAIFMWVMCHMVPFFYMAKSLGLLRVSPMEEHDGLDISHHGGAAYPTDKIDGNGALSGTEMRREIEALKAAVKKIQHDVEASS